MPDLKFLRTEEFDAVAAQHGVDVREFINDLAAKLRKVIPEVAENFPATREQITPTLLPPFTYVGLDPEEAFEMLCIVFEVTHNPGDFVPYHQKIASCCIGTTVTMLLERGLSHIPIAVRIVGDQYYYGNS